MASTIDKQIDVTTGDMTQEEAQAPEYTRLYQVYENSRIPVSKHLGKLWEKRWQEIKQFYDNEDLFDRWDEVIRYYQNDQISTANRRGDLGNMSRRRGADKSYTTENIVFANVSALLPSTYAKNPDISITSTKKDEASQSQAKLFERLLDTLIKRKTAPGINLKPKARKLVTATMLTNIAYLDLSYTLKQNSSEQAIEEIEKLSKELAEAKDTKTIMEIEGKLLALEQNIALLAPPGPKVKFRMPYEVFVDPTIYESDTSDASYMIVADYIRTDYLRAMYGRKNDDGEYMSIFQPTHVLKANRSDGEDMDNSDNFTLLGENYEHEKYGYNNAQEFEYNCRTLVWTVWDKTTRRVYMFNSSDWTWPIWVWDDPYKLSRFFPIFPLTFYCDPEDPFARSEVMYYLDQQDEINRANNERARMRHWAMTKVFVNSTLIKDVNTVYNFLTEKGDDKIHGIPLPENARISDAIGAFPAPSTQFAELFDTRPLYEGINRLSSVTPIMQNVQYKTNTTNKAIESYESSTQTRLDEKIDAIEELLGDLGRALLEMCIQFMTTKEVTDLLGAEFVAECGGWFENRNVDEFNQNFNFEIVGGSTLKPTAKVKKEQALQLGQILGQFANAAPMAIVVMLRALERAFGDDVTITDAEWKAIIMSIQQQMQRGTGSGGPPQQEQQGQQPQQQGEPPPEAVNAVMEQVQVILQRLPPQARQFLAEGINRGVPLQQLMQQIQQAARSNQQQQ